MHTAWKKGKNKNKNKKHNLIFPLTCPSESIGSKGSFCHKKILSCQAVSCTSKLSSLAILIEGAGGGDSEKAEIDGGVCKESVTWAHPT